jgi:glycosyltransferase involved in cell wall biosynthesis
MFNLVRHSDPNRFRFTAGFFSENMYVPRYRDLGVEVTIIPSIPARRAGPIVARKAINWYNREYKLEKHLYSYLQKNRFDILLLNNTIFESVNFIRAGNRVGMPIVAYERGIMNYSREHIHASQEVDASIAVSEAIRKNMVKYKFQSGKLELIYDGIDPSAFEGPFDPVGIKKHLRIPADSKVVGILGNVRYWKGQKYFIEAIRYLSPSYRNLYGLIIGGWSDADREYINDLRATIEDAGLEDRILFLGYRNDAPALLSILDVFVHASISPEPFGMVLLETPVIATRFGGPLEILDHGECGALVPPKDGEAIAQECRRYLSDESYRRNTVDKAYRRLCEKFHIRTTVDQVGRLLETVRRDRSERR